MTTTTDRLRTKAPARAGIASRDELCAALDDLAFDRARMAQVNAEAYAAAAEIAADRERRLAPLEANAEALFGRIQAYAEAHRAELTAAGGKSVPVGAHAIAWRQRPPRVALSIDAGLVLDELRRLGLGRFIALKESIDKRAMLKEPATAAGIPGVDILTGEEEFIVETAL